MPRHFLVIVAGAFAASLTVHGQQPAGTVSSPTSRGVATRSGASNAARTTPAPRPLAEVRSLDPRILPGTSDSAFSTIQGNALDSAGAPMPQTAVRLRDARTGRIVDSQLTNDTGMFTFQSVDPGSYVVEMLGNGQTVLAASQLLSVNAGDAMSAVVKIPFRIPPFAGFLGHTASSAAAVAASAVSAEVLAVTANKCASPPCNHEGDIQR